jgi:hypothetical protein
VTTTILIEDSETPIYSRIVHSIKRSLDSKDIEVTLLAIRQFNVDSYQKYLTEHADAIYLSTADSNLIQQRIPNQPGHFFEGFPGRLIFLHQDSMLSGVSKLTDAIERWQALRRVSSRSYHLCLEHGNTDILRLLGVKNSAGIAHASEIEMTAPLLDEPLYPISFVGHVLPWNPTQPISEPRTNQLFTRLMALRRADFARPLQNEIALACLDLSEGDILITVAYQQWMRALMNSFSVPFRGSVITEARLPSLAIFGGDPAYLHKAALDRRIDQPQLSYHPPVYELDKVREIYRRSGVTINISSPQFDQAVPNRFHDAILSGGLCLTDRRGGLSELTRYADEVSYSSVAELRDKAIFFCRPENRRTRASLIRAIQGDIARNSGYEKLARSILSATNYL